MDNSSFIPDDYCTDVAGIAAGVVGTLMLIARLFDGASIFYGCYYR